MQHLPKNYRESKRGSASFPPMGWLWVGFGKCCIHAISDSGYLVKSKQKIPEYFTAGFFTKSLISACLIIFLTASTGFANNDFADIFLQQKPAQIQDNEFKKEKGVLVGGVSVTSDLPQEFYGTWSVISVLVNTNNPELFRMRSSDIWTFERKGDVIILSNPVNRASASITVNEVRGKTAVFTRITQDENTYEIETPEITVEGDSFYGTDLIIIKHFKNGQRIKTDRVKYKVKGYKISGPALKDIFAR